MRFWIQEDKKTVVLIDRPCNKLQIEMCVYVCVGVWIREREILGVNFFTELKVWEDIIYYFV
jgi:hypothetical protein